MKLIQQIRLFFAPWLRKKNKKVEEFTNFSENEMMDIWRRVEPKVIASRRRGPCPKISALDSTVLLLVFYKTNLDFERIAGIFKLKTGTLQDSITRIRPIVYQALREDWWVGH